MKPVIKFILLSLLCANILHSQEALEVENFGKNPGNLKMFVYNPVPTETTKKPLVIVLHGCTQNAKEVAASTIEAVKENASKYYQQGVEKAKEVEKNLEGKIKEYPLKSLLIAVGVGALVGMLIKRR